jgi:hypothetical protein
MFGSAAVFPAPKRKIPFCDHKIWESRTMPRLTQAFPKYRRHKQTGHAIVTINGRDYLLGPHGTKASKFEYDRLINEWLSSGRSPAYGV